MRLSRGDAGLPYLGARSCSCNRNHLHIRVLRLACLAASRMRVKWEFRYRRRLHASRRTNTVVGLRAMRVESGRGPGPWGLFEGKARRTGDRDGESSSLRLGRETWEAWCGGGSRRASSTLGAVVGIVVRTCSRCCCGSWSWCRDVVG
jgi:hypothetical protein